MSGLAEPYRWLRTTTPDPDPRHHSGLCEGIFGKDSFDHAEYEGMFLFKAKRKRRRQGRRLLYLSSEFQLLSSEFWVYGTSTFASVAAFCGSSIAWPSNLRCSSSRISIWTRLLPLKSPRRTASDRGSSR